MGDGQARAEILARVRQAGVVAGAGHVETFGRERAAGGGGAGTASGDAVAGFIERLAARGVGVQHVADPDDLPRVVASSLWANGVRRIAVPRDLSALWLSELDGVWITRDDPPGSLSVRAIEAAGAAVTGCAVAVAETGTLVLDGGPRQGRKALALLPAHHLCVVESRRIVPTVAEALERLDPLRSTVWLTGTTRTTAIDQAAVAGPHGPARIDVVVVD
ncbi:LutC/YkgG family protein [Marinactinospora thermotolerans]|uniref:L-lactate dehydrogenase complex protein LldG n=1 Tax=Marinactinospora thermotolerans DSM 45154 TaxID=1122192 RepID=A0A1T4KAQ7_9ACTN|nr:LUD domain-containing protein [Marinactinospora thermotolerans]SJZ39413.1 L-lactate dehydrogenase complex protein LldG [Marinactinospora thermotolerans DSM 45154]